MVRKDFFEERSWYVNMETLQLCKEGGTVPSRRNSKCQGPKEGVTLVTEGTEKRPGWPARSKSMGETNRMRSKSRKGLDYVGLCCQVRGLYVGSGSHQRFRQGRDMISLTL